MNQEMEWEYDSMCFACGERNPMGLKLKFELVDDATVRTTFIPEQWHQSWSGMMHGGLTATIADELMGRCINALGYAGMTARLELRYKKAIPLGEAVIFEATVIKKRLPIIDLEALGILSDGQVALEAQARFMIKGSYAEFIEQLKQTEGGHHDL